MTTALHYAAEHNLDKVASVLLENASIDVNAEKCPDPGGYRETPLSISAWSDEKRILPVLFSRSGIKNTVLHWWRAPDLDDGDHLQKHIRNPLVNRIFTPLHLAAMLNPGNIAGVLKEPGIDVNVKDHLGRPPLFYATGRICQRHRSLPLLLVAPGPNVDSAVVCDGSGVR